MKRQSGSKLEIKERRIFSDAFKKQVVKDLVSKRTSVNEVTVEHQVSRQSVYKWLYRYSGAHESKCTLVVQMKSEATKTQDLKNRLAELERVVGQKQLEIDFLNKLLEIGSKELDFDIKKNFSSKLSNGSGSANSNTDTG
jgi:transposase